MRVDYPEITPVTLEMLLQERFKEGFLTLKDLPHPSAFKDMDKAVQRIVKAVRSGEKITVIGDYDVDGVVSTTIMKLFFDEIGYPVEWIIPNRFEDGYGLSPGIVSKIKGTDLAITVDNGISAVEAANICMEEGIELIITDHHIVPEILPAAYAVVNQKQAECTFPYHEVCGAQIAWYLAAAVKNALGLKIDMAVFLEFVAIAVIADVMPLHHINRAMVSAGLRSLSKSNRPFIRAFMEQIGKVGLASDDIAFFLAPLLNSAGRMDDASHAVDFLCASNIYDARIRMERLMGFNAQRKEAEEVMTFEALSQADGEDKVIVVWGEEWHEGVVGIVAARVARIHKKPAIVLSSNGKGMLKGSGRTYHECDLFEVANRCSGYLEKFGGHKAAIGLSLHKENVIPFKDAIQTSYLFDDHPQFSTDPQIAGVLDFTWITPELITLIKQYEPYGEGNPRPKFITRNVIVRAVSPMGKEQNHLRYVLEYNGICFTALKFKSTEQYPEGSLIDISYTLSENSYKGNVSLQLLIDNIEHS